MSVHELYSASPQKGQKHPKGCDQKRRIGPGPDEQRRPRHKEQKDDNAAHDTCHAFTKKRSGFHGDGQEQQAPAVQREGWQQIESTEHKADAGQQVRPVPSRNPPGTGGDECKQKAGARAERCRYNLCTVGQPAAVNQREPGHSSRMDAICPPDSFSARTCPSSWTATATAAAGRRPPMSIRHRTARTIRKPGPI